MPDVPVIPGDMGALAEHASQIAGGATGIAHTGALVHSAWQGLRAFYRAPEAETLFAVTVPVATAATAVGDAGSATAAALTSYAGTVAELQRQLEQLRGQADILRQTLADADPAAPPRWRCGAGSRPHRLRLRGDPAGLRCRPTHLRRCDPRRRPARLRDGHPVVGRVRGCPSR